jgi:hypothetical protein
MTVVFRFESPDHDRCCVMMVDSCDAAISHICDIINGPDVPHDRQWTIDEEGTQIPHSAWLRRRFDARTPVVLFDQDSLGTLETVEIRAA